MIDKSNCLQTGAFVDLRIGKMVEAEKSEQLYPSNCITEALNGVPGTRDIWLNGPRDQGPLAKF